MSIRYSLFGIPTNIEEAVDALAKAGRKKATITVTQTRLPANKTVHTSILQLGLGRLPGKRALRLALIEVTGSGKSSAQEATENRAAHKKVNSAAIGARNLLRERGISVKME